MVLRLTEILDRAFAHVRADGDRDFGERLAPFNNGNPVPAITVTGWRRKSTCEYRYLNMILELCHDADILWLLTGKQAEQTVTVKDYERLQGRLEEAQLVRKECDDRIRSLLDSCERQMGHPQKQSAAG